MLSSEAFESLAPRAEGYLWRHVFNVPPLLVS
jgi:hypothetical protein